MPGFGMNMVARLEKLEKTFQAKGDDVILVVFRDYGDDRPFPKATLEQIARAKENGGVLIIGDGEFDEEEPDWEP